MKKYICLSLLLSLFVLFGCAGSIDSPNFKDGLYFIYRSTTKNGNQFDEKTSFHKKGNLWEHKCATLRRRAAGQPWEDSRQPPEPDTPTLYTHRGILKKTSQTNFLIFQVGKMLQEWLPLKKRAPGALLDNLTKFGNAEVKGLVDWKNWKAWKVEFIEPTSKNEKAIWYYEANSGWLIGRESIHGQYKTIYVLIETNSELTID